MYSLSEISLSVPVKSEARNGLIASIPSNVRENSVWLPPHNFSHQVEEIFSLVSEYVSFRVMRISVKVLSTLSNIALLYLPSTVSPPNLFLLSAKHCCNAADETV